MPGSIGDDSIKKDIQNVIDKLTNEVLPTMSGKNKDELNEIITYLDDTKAKLPAYIENDDNRIKFLTSIMNLSEAIEFYSRPAQKSAQRFKR